MEILTAIGLALPIAIAARWLVLKGAPLLVTKGRLKTWGLAWVLGIGGNYLAKLLWPGPTLGGVSLWGTAVGALVAVLALGLYPFLKIMVGRA